MAITILADLDGTLLPRPYNDQEDKDSSTETTPAETTNDDISPRSQPMPKVVHPNLSEGPAYEPLVRLLDLGATVVGITGSQLSTHRRRFFDELPLHHRRDGRVMLAVQTGSQLYVGHGDDGRPIRDVEFDSHLSESISTQLDNDTVNELVDIGRRGLAQFYTDLVNEPTIVDRDGPLGYLVDVARKLMAEKTTKGENIIGGHQIPITDGVHDVPRIEVRENNSAVVFVGVPSSLGRNYFDVPQHLRSMVDGKPTGRSCYDCVPAGMDKSHVVRYLIRTNVIRHGRTVALGDQPAGNDAGLTLWHGSDAPMIDGAASDEKKCEEEMEGQSHTACTIPFISVSECHTMVPHRLNDCHVSRVTNAEGSAKVLAELAETLEDECKAEGVSFCTPTMRSIVKKVNDNASRNNSYRGNG